MPKTLGLSSPVYEIPFDDNTLLVVGRIALMWGQIVFHLDWLLKVLKGMSDAEAEKYETKSVKAKLADLWTELSKPINKSHRAVLRRVHETVDQLALDRNVVFHGLWGHYLPPNGGSWRVAAKSYSRKEPFYADDLKALHERMIGASEALAEAYGVLDLVRAAPLTERNRRQLWTPKGWRGPLPEVPRKLAR
jgi:hypothetical protein